MEQIFEPESRRYEFRLNQCLMKTNGAKVTKLRFTRPKTVDLVAEAQAFSMLSAGGGVTPNQIREFQNKPKFNAKWADTPISILKMGLLEDKENEEGTATLADMYGDKLISPEAKFAAENQQKSQEGQQSFQKRLQQLSQSTQRTQTRLVSEAVAELHGADAAEIHDFISDVKTNLTQMGFSVEIGMPENLFEE